MARSEEVHPCDCDAFEDADDDDDFEEWEAYAELIERKDYPALVRYCEAQVRRFPKDRYAAYYLGDAYVQDGEYEKALAFMAPHHRGMPDNEDYQHVIIEALFALGRTEDDFDWVERPIVYRLNREVLNACHRHLAGKRNPRTASDLFGELFSDGYTAFSQRDLVEQLRADPRFIVESAEGWVLADIRVRRPGSKRKLPSSPGRPGEPQGN